MKRIKTHHAQWALGASATLASLGSAQAALVKVDLNHDLTTSLDGVDFGFGLGSDAGQWSGGVGGFGFFVARFYFSRVVGGAYSNSAFRSGSVLVGSNIFGVYNFDIVLTSGLIAWDLSDGTEGWLHVTGDPSVPSLRADYFAFDDAVLGVAGGRTAGNLAHGGDSEAFASASNFTGAAVPEPSSLALLALGAAGVIGRRRRQAA